MARMSDAEKYLARKRRRRSEGFPIGTVAYYGPTDQFASKVAVGVISERDEMIAMERWFATDVDIREDEGVMEEVAAFLQEHGVYRVAMTERIIGCPHEEGKDYPEGESCPECPFWEGRDRWTGELLH